MLFNNIKITILFFLKIQEIFIQQLNLIGSQSTNTIYSNNKGCADANALRLYPNRPPHFFNNIFTNTQA